MPWGPTCRVPSICRRWKARIRRRKTSRSPASRSPTSPFAAWSSRSWPTRTAICTTSASIPAGSRPTAGCSTRARTRRRTCRSSGGFSPTSAKQVEAVEAGDIIGVIGLRQSVTGDTLCDAHDPILLESIQFPETVDLHGHRAGEFDRAEEARRRAGNDEAAGPDLPRPRKSERPARR